MFWLRKSTHIYQNPQDYRTHLASAHNPNMTPSMIVYVPVRSKTTKTHTHTHTHTHTSTASKYTLTDYEVWRHGRNQPHLISTFGPIATPMWGPMVPSQRMPLSWHIRMTLHHIKTYGYNIAVAMGPHFGITWG